MSGSGLPKRAMSNQGQVNGVISFKKILKGNFVSSAKPDQTNNIPGHSIVEPLNQIRAM